ncbi:MULTISPECIES: alpha/beta fold hydrolase [Streptomyces]|uniref:alpha/beta fold hydrolase n=1 Tax=Streptomyces TaxID=1883 RepID=UPI0001D06432|nr:MULTISPECIES: alpha/beta hydrolase [Streptomyces]MYS47119.1 alpha/beta fold hydrolase [Streptomyces sp. SID5998]MYX46115.1 alpha/beta fold hydrolase [Streptomyces sp. SID89]NED74856.1 alpha/beta hydrolase [Streptomyces sp. SID9944]EFF88517.1 proteoglycan-4 [Streptomyces sp. e14]MBY8865851.1 alpha/beta hydrolase [Streptomyces sennicomposti]
MPIADSDGTEIYYERHGSGPAILFVHGSGGHHAAWWQQVAALRDEFTVVTVDLRGFGKSEAPIPAHASKPEFDGQDFPGDVAAVLDAEDLTDVMLVGQSIGSVAALRAGLLRPERVSSVVLGHSLGGISHPELRELAAADRAEAVKLPVVDRLLTKAFQRERADLTFLFQQMGTFNVARMQDLRNLDTDGPGIEDIQASGLKVAFLAGEKDAVLSVKTVTRAHELLAGSHLEIVPGAPHSMYWETPEQYNAAVAELRRTLTAK